MKKIMNVIHQAMNQIKAIEAAIVAALLWWSFILAIPYDTFGSSIAYDAMADIASEEVWSGIFFVVALGCLYGMLFERHKVRQISLIVSTGLWAFVAAMFAIGYIATTSTGIYFIVACLNAYVVYKVGEQRGC